MYNWIGPISKDEDFRHWQKKTKTEDVFNELVCSILFTSTQ